MSEFGRRTLLGGMGAGPALAGIAAVTGRTGAATAATAGKRPTTPSSTPDVVMPADSRYGHLVTGFNQRWVGTPEQVRVIRSTDDAVAAVQYAVKAGKRISVRSGGHCFENFVYNRDVQVVLDMSTMDQVSFDPTYLAFMVEPGAILLNVYNTLYRKWGVTIPAGLCYSVGAGGHIAGGGHGFLSRQFGLAVDHLYAVEVVVVDATGTAKAVVATADPKDPNHDLWWAHTGGGGGNFGLVTRYWFRTPGATGKDPGSLLPKPPSTVLLNELAIPWSAVSEADFGRLLQNFAAWHQAHSAPGAPETAVSSLFGLNHVAAGVLTLVTQVDATVPNGAQLLADHLAAIGAGTATAVRQALAAAPVEVLWGGATRFIATSNYSHPAIRTKAKSAYLKTNFTTAQTSVIYQQLHTTDFRNPSASVIIFPYGGQVNAVAPDATAVPQRDSILLLSPGTEWVNPSDDAANINWIRDLFQQMFSTTGGVPVSNATWDGCYINYVDTDMQDPTQNTSGVPWFTLYYKNNYPRLQQVKQKWDPKSIFQHDMSVQLH